MNPEVLAVLLGLSAIIAIRAHVAIHKFRKLLDESQGARQSLEGNKAFTDRMYQNEREERRALEDKIEKLKAELKWRQADYDATLKMRDNYRDDLRLAKDKITKLEALLKTAMEN